MAVTTDGTKVRAQAKWVRTSARKARLVLDHIRGRTVPEARTILASPLAPRRRTSKRMLRSAVATPRRTTAWTATIW